MRLGLSGVRGWIARCGQQAWQVVKTGKFVLPGLFMMKTRKKAATKGGTRVMFGKEMKVKAQPAKTVAAWPLQNECFFGCFFGATCRCRLRTSARLTRIDKNASRCVGSVFHGAQVKAYAVKSVRDQF